MGMYGFLCTVSPARRHHLDEDPDLVHELAAARREGKVPGLLNLEKSWDALDLLLSDRGQDDLLGDAILARHGRPVGTEGAYGQARLLTAERVRAIAEALMRLPTDVVQQRAGKLAVAKPEPHGGYEDTDEFREQLRARLVAVRDLFVTAAKAGHGMLAMVV